MNNSLFPISTHLSNNLVIKNDGSVAILMRTKNRPILLARAIESVIQQKYSNWHLYLVNDGGELAIVDNLIKLNQADLKNRLTVINNSVSLGREKSFNCGFHLATEEFLVIHDDDDSWHPNFLHETVIYLQNNKDAVAVVTKCIIINEEIIDNTTVKQLNIHDWSNWQDQLDITNLIQGNSIPSISLLIRTKIAKFIGEFNENLSILSNWDYYLRLARIGEIKTLNKKLAYEHHRPNINNIYGNSFISESDKYFKYKIEYKNSLIRQLLNNNNHEGYELLYTFLINNEQKKNELIEKLNYLDNKLNEIHYLASYLERKSFPLKKIAAKFRNKLKEIRKK